MKACRKDERAFSKRMLPLVAIFVPVKFYGKRCPEYLKILKDCLLHNGRDWNLAVAQTIVVTAAVLCPESVHNCFVYDCSRFSERGLEAVGQTLRFCGDEIGAACAFVGLGFERTQIREADGVEIGVQVGLVAQALGAGCTFVCHTAAEGCGGILVGLGNIHNDWFF